MIELRSTDMLMPLPGVDATQLTLSSEEAFVMTRVGGPISVRDLVSSTGLAEPRVHAAVARLLQLHVIRLGGAAAELDEDDEVVDTGPPKLTDAQRAEKVDIPLDMRQRIVEVEYMCLKQRHYDVLGIGRTAAPSEVKRAYFERSKEFHPDAYFRKELGSFGPRLERIFKQLKQSYEVLGDGAARVKYDTTLGRQPAKSSKPAERPAWLDDPRRKAEMEARRLRRNPMVQRVERARRHMQRARELYDQKAYAQATNEIGLAIAQDPGNVEIREMQEKIRTASREERIVQLLHRVEVLLNGFNGDEEALAEAVREAVELDSTNTTVYLRMARSLLRIGNARLARGPADCANKLAPDDEKVLAMMVDLYEQAGMGALALRSLEKLVKLYPDEPRAERLKKMHRAR